MKLVKHLFEFDWYMRLNENAKRVFVLAQEECTRMGGHERIGTSQLLLGFIQEGRGIAAKALKSNGVKILPAREEVEKIIGRGTGCITYPLLISQRVERVLELSYISKDRQDQIIGTGHLLFGLIREGEGVGCRVLINLGVDLAELQKEIVLESQFNSEKVS